MKIYQRSCRQGLNERAPATRGEVEETHSHTSTKQNVFFFPTFPSYIISSFATERAYWFLLEWTGACTVGECVRKISRSLRWRIYADVSFIDEWSALSEMEFIHQTQNMWVYSRNLIRSSIKWTKRGDVAEIHLLLSAPWFQPSAAAPFRVTHLIDTADKM